MMATIPIKIDEIELAKIDILVKRGQYKNRSQAIKSMLLTRLNQEYQPITWESPEEVKLQEKIFHELMNQPNHYFSIKTGKSAHEIIAAEREQY
jgi:Arc/MetJ-type ribon-helix-helix transcriptional regulator